MKVLDLFSGIGGFSLGLERAGFETVAFCEIEPYCQAVLKKHWPGVPIYNDVRKLDGKEFRGTDVICGGFPCQDLSAAGKRSGITGERSGLWKEYVRIISEVRPKYVVVENVTALLSGGNGGWFGTVLGDLAEIGYDAEWHCIPASAVGAPHRRDRVWIVAYPRSQSKHRAIFPQNSKELGRFKEIGCEDWQFFEMVAGVPTGFGKWREMGEPGLVREDDGIPSVLDRLHALGNAVVPQIPEIIGRAIMQYKPKDKE